MKDTLQLANRLLQQEKCPLIIERVLGVYSLLVTHGAPLILTQYPNTLLSFFQALGNLRDKSQAYEVLVDMIGLKINTECIDKVVREYREAIESRSSLSGSGKAQLT